MFIRSEPCKLDFFLLLRKMAVLRFYSSEALIGRALQRAAKLFPHLSITTELCYNVELTGEIRLDAEQKEVLLWLFRPPLQAEPLSDQPRLTEGRGDKLVEIGPSLSHKMMKPLLIIWRVHVSCFCVPYDRSETLSRL
uniref:Uncharacterized protein n=1 Tax=Xiphophorus couchianus TaxID=32473 RepID=A0A3B5LM20_9TELE